LALFVVLSVAINFVPTPWWGMNSVIRNLPWYSLGAWFGATLLVWIKESIGRFFITDINNPAPSALADSELPVMFDIWGIDEIILSGGGIAPVFFNHIPAGGNVLYADGHVEWLNISSDYPFENPDPNFFKDPADLVSYSWQMAIFIPLLTFGL